jgi:hypothetical protein
MTREDYERYAAAFNARDYDTVFDFYAENPRMAFFGVEITTRDQLRAFYTSPPLRARDDHGRAFRRV